MIGLHVTRSCTTTANILQKANILPGRGDSGVEVYYHAHTLRFKFGYFVCGFSLPPISHIFACFWQDSMILKYIHRPFKTTHFTQFFLILRRKHFLFQFYIEIMLCPLYISLNFFAIILQTTNFVWIFFRYIIFLTISKISPILCVFSPIYPHFVYT